jgi:hydroxymethylbilane synthase
MTLPYSAERPIRIGTRASPLAMAQAHETRNRLLAAHDLPPEAVVIIDMTTTGDRRLELKLGEIGGKGLFTKEIEAALVDRSTDLAVHSMKDMPTVLPDGMEISTLLPREDVRDAFISPKFKSIDDLPAGSLVGTASLRRQAQLLHRRPDLKVGLFRGNVQTRLRKLDEGEADATFLAMAGLNRLGMTEVATAALETDEMLPAVAQGAVGIEIRSDDDAIRAVLAPLNCKDTEIRTNAERAFLNALDGSCRTPIASLATIDGDRLTLRGEILRPDGSERFATTREGSLSDAVAMGRDAGAELRAKGGPDFFVSH